MISHGFLRLGLKGRRDRYTFLDTSAGVICQKTWSTALDFCPCSSGHNDHLRSKSPCLEQPPSVKVEIFDRPEIESKAAHDLRTANNDWWLYDIT